MNWEQYTPRTSLIQMVLLGVCNDLIVKHERPLPEEIDVARNLAEYARLQHIQTHGPSEEDVLHYEREEKALRNRVETVFSKEIDRVRKENGLLDAKPSVKEQPRIEIVGSTFSRREYDDAASPIIT